MRHLRQPELPHVRPIGRGFTLIEMLVVVGIVILLAAAAAPAVRMITGSRSLESTNNLVSAMLARAHQQAINDTQYRGVFFFLDVTADRTAMVMVQREGESDPDPGFDAYKGWTGVNPDPTVNYYNSSNGLIQVPSFVSALAYSAAEGKYISTKFQCLLDHLSASGNEAGTAGGTAYWGLSAPRFLDVLPGAEVQYLPSGVGCQVITDPLGNPINATTRSGLYDRYMRTGAILFDSVGHFDSAQWAIRANSTLSRLLNPPVGLPADLDPPSATVGVAPVSGSEPILWSGFGVAVYDRAAFNTGQLVPVAVAGGAVINPGITSAKFKPSEQDFMLQIPSLGAAPNLVDEANEELWLDANAMLLWVDRSGGATIKGF